MSTNRKFKWKREIDWCNGWCFEDEAGPAGECSAREGELHRLGCPYERCTQCGDQFLYCDCPEPFEERKRVPYFRVWGHQHCARCDRPWPEFFDVADEAWQFYILSLGHGDMLLCVDCFNLIAELTDGGACLRRHGVPIMIDDPDYMRVVDKRNALTRMRQQQPGVVANEAGEPPPAAERQHELDQWCTYTRRGGTP